MSKVTLFSTYPELRNVSFTADGRKEIQSFVLRTNPLSESLTNSVIKYYKDFAISYDKSLVDDKRKLDFEAIFRGGNKSLVIEIGFGNGSSFVKMAEKNPNTNYLGFEVYLNGFAECLTSIGEKNLTNARVMRADVMPILENCIEPNSIDGINIFFPDPWPKKRHHKRRIMNDNLVSLVAPLLKDGGFLHFATDIEDYAISSLECLSKSKELRNEYDGFAPSRLDRENSTFEAKAILDGRRIYDIFFKKHLTNL